MSRTLSFYLGADLSRLSATGRLRQEDHEFASQPRKYRETLEGKNERKEEREGGRERRGKKEGGKEGR